jgi:anti-anti-sigma regulatory factor
METIQPDAGKPVPFTIERKEGKALGTVIFRLSGPFTARTMFGTLTPIDFDNILSFQSTPGEKPPTLNIIDLTEVPYMDSSGLGRMMNHLVHCNGKGIRMIVAGASPRVLELFRMTKVDSALTVAATVDEAETK